MRNFTHPLDDIKIASPCSADWNEMYGNDRKRFCGDCKLNVYNLSDMTRAEAENLLMISEGRLCVRFFRRADGTVLTKNCPVGWRAVKQRASRIATAAFSVLTAFFAGMLSIRASDSFISILPIGNVPSVAIDDFMKLVKEDRMEVGVLVSTEWQDDATVEEVRGKPSQSIRSIQVIGRP